jgi:hypothetical protein
MKFIHAQEAPSSTSQDIFHKIFEDSLAKFSRILWSFQIVDDTLWYLTN